MGTCVAHTDEQTSTYTYMHTHTHSHTHSQARIDHINTYFLQSTDFKLFTLYHSLLPLHSLALSLSLSTFIILKDVVILLFFATDIQKDGIFVLLGVED